MDDWGEPSRLRDMQRRGRIGEFAPLQDKNIKTPITERIPPRQHSRRGRRRERRQVGLPGNVEQDVDVKTPLGLPHQLARRNTVQEETAGDPPQHVLLGLREYTKVYNGLCLFKKGQVRAVTVYGRHNERHNDMVKKPHVRKKLRTS